MAIRIAIGSGQCASGLKSRNKTLRKLCGRVLDRLDGLRALSAEQLRDLPESTELEWLEQKRVLINIFRESQQDSVVLVVVQGFFPTWWLPTYISADGVGHIFAEGVVVTPDGRVDNRFR
jgi:hypothetical protein